MHMYNLCISYDSEVFYLKDYENHHTHGYTHVCTDLLISNCSSHQQRFGGISVAPLITGTPYTYYTHNITHCIYNTIHCNTQLTVDFHKNG